MKEKELKTIEEAVSRLSIAMPYIKAAVAMARAEGTAGLAVITEKPDGSGRLTARFEAEAFFADLATVSNTALCAAVRGLNERLNGFAATEHDIRVECSAREGEGAGAAVTRALRERDARIAKLEAAARKVVNIGWGHGDDCLHCYCEDGAECGDGTVSEKDGCEATGKKCDCYVRDRDALAVLLASVPAKPSKNRETMKKKRWYVSDPDNGITIFNSEDEARNEAEHILAQLADDSDEGWHENMEDLHWGRIMPSQIATQVNQRKAPEGSEFDMLCEYELRTVPQ